MNDLKEIVFYFAGGSKLVPVDIAKSISERFEDIGNPIVLNPPQGGNAPLVIFQDNKNMKITVTQMTVNMVIDSGEIKKIDTIIFDLVDLFEQLNIKFVKMGLVYSIFLSRELKSAIYNKILNDDYIPDDLEDVRLAWYKKLNTKVGVLNCWERIITDSSKFDEVLFQFDFNTLPTDEINFDMKFIKNILKVAEEYSEERIDVL